MTLLAGDYPSTPMSTSVMISCFKQHQYLARIDVASENWWRVPFNRDPDTPDIMLSHPTSSIEVFLTSYEMVNENRRVRSQVSAPTYQSYKEYRKKINLSYLDEVTFTRHQLLWESYCASDEAISSLGESRPDWSVAMDLMTTLQQQQRLMEIGQICKKGDGFEAFLSSHEFFAVPFLSVRAKLMAADVVYESHREPEPSLQDDFSIVATVLPYSSVFATENYIAELIRKTKIADDYDCQVFTMRRKQELLDLLLTL